MPKYEYACKSCGQRLEVMQSFSDPPLTECEACGGPLRKVFTPPGITFKGSGFYRTDNAKRRSEPKSEAKAETKADAPSSTDGKADAKVESTPKESAPAAESKPKATEAKTA